jgi:hypothetical protein
MSRAAQVSLKAGLQGVGDPRDVARLHAKAESIGAGFPDFAAPMPMKDAACRAIRRRQPVRGDLGQPEASAAIAKRTSEYNRIPTGDVEHVTVCCGATEAMTRRCSPCRPSDEVIVRALYENYGPDCIPRAPCRAWLFARAGLTIDERAARAFNAKTRAIIVNTPHNPTGKVRAPSPKSPPRSASSTTARVHRRDLRVHLVRSHRAHLDRDAARCSSARSRSAACRRLERDRLAHRRIAPAALTGAIRGARLRPSVPPRRCKRPPPRRSRSGRTISAKLARDYRERRDVVRRAARSRLASAAARAYYVMTVIRA